MSNRDAVNKLLSLLTDYTKEIIVVIGCLLLSTVLNLCVPLLSRRIMDDGFIGGDGKLLVQLVLCSLLIYLVSSAVDLLKEIKRVDVAAKLQYFLSEESYSHLMRLKADYFVSHNDTEIMNNLSVDIDHMVSIADENTFFVVTQAFSVTGGIIGLFMIDWRMTLLVLMFIPVRYAIMKYFARRRKKAVDVLISAYQEYAGWFGDNIGGVREVKLFGIYVHKHREFDDIQSRIICRNKEMSMFDQKNRMTSVILSELLTALIYIVGSNLVFGMQLSVGSVFAFITYSTYVTGPISAMINIGYLMSGILPSTKRYCAFMDMPEEELGTDYVTIPRVGDIEFKQVSFAYEEDKTVLDNISFRIPEGSKTALLGRNGSGKSTVVELLLRMYTPEQGEILLDGQSIFHMSLEAYRKMFSVVSQNIYLFHDTIRNNICLYRQVEEEQIMEACRDSGLSEFIEEVSLDYSVGNDGMMLSGGQKQKIALARALIHDCPIVIFDEATSSSDVCSEQQINSLLHTRLKDKTVVVITHREAVLSEVDQVIRLDNGMIGLNLEFEQEE